MSRVDVPTLRCDRCGRTTQDLREMASFRTLSHTTPSPRTLTWDLCPGCWKGFMAFVDGDGDE